jgi:hypothetical protein
LCGAQDDPVTEYRGCRRDFTTLGATLSHREMSHPVKQADDGLAHTKEFHRQ